MNPNQPLTSEEINQAYKVELFDQDGKKIILKELIKDKKVILIFIRHFWCTNCQVYTYQLNKSIPSSSLSNNIESCGSFKPILQYIQNTQSNYKILTCPSLEIHKIFNLKKTLKGPSFNDNDDNKKNYLDEVGGMGALGHPKVYINLDKPGPKVCGYCEKIRGPNDQNGGEVIFEQDGTCSYIHRMQNTVDHTDIEDLAKMIGVKYIPLTEEQKAFPG
uniref:Zinc finger CHCC-type domain-containing protein n=1 Tax=Kwoniella pini CBS 10737 TaxID=1296096 RepID=A0A1B9I9G7_9TREE|nr:uncharacterized protein I206_01484 [Kwoniella pini CBS 10737]OCF52199.1 hypothetical protein I206_01484 [Kwoniella pini CBS 10737]